MNERILELALQAGEYVNSVYQPPVRSKSPGKIWEDGHIGWNEQFQAKFAELIIRECLRMCDVAEINYALYDKLKEADGAIGAKEQIENHFGVD